MLSLLNGIISASKEPHPKVRLQQGGWKTVLSGSTLLQRSHTRRCGYNTTSTGAFAKRAKVVLQRSHTRRCGYNSLLGQQGKIPPRFKGATPEGAVTTDEGRELGESAKASKEPHPKVRLQRMARFLWLATTASLQRSHTRRCGYNTQHDGLEQPEP